jgi:hypothetical protein
MWFFKLNKYVQEYEEILFNKANSFRAEAICGCYFFLSLLL